MLTIVAWIVFLPAAAWNVVFFGVVFADIINADWKYFKYTKNYVQAAASLAILFVPGVYLFGWY